VAIKGSGDPLCFNLLQELAPVAALVSIAPLVDWGEVPQIVWILLAATGVTHGAYFFWMSRAYEHGDLSLVYPIARSTPAFVPLVAVPLFGESISPGGGVGIAIVVVGIWLVHGGGGGGLLELSSPAARFAYLTLMATVGYSLLDKAAMANLAAAEWSSVIPRPVVYSLLPVVYSLLIAGANTVVFAPLVLRTRGLAALREAAHTQLGRATAASLVSFASYTLILAALQTALVSYVVAARQTSVLFAVGLGVALLGERPGRARVAGALATVAGVALIAVAR
jgi:drug/metabolite transporter (DMT)-like permease